jgi:uncharacterized protein YecT (DUF1311 family)
VKVPAAFLTISLVGLLAGCSAQGAESAGANEKPTAAVATADLGSVNDCASANSHVAWRECAVLERDRADAALKEQFQTTLNRLRQVNAEDFAIRKAQGWGTEEYRQHQEAYVQSLLRSQDAWMTYRKEYCAVAKFPGRGGNSNLEIFIGCEMPLIKARIEQLQTLTKELQSDG